MKTYVHLKILSSTLTPDQVSRLVGLRCDKQWKIGDRRANTIIIEKNHGWVLNSGLPTTASLEEHVTALLEKIKPSAASIRQLSLENTVEFSCVIYSEHRPGIYFEKEMIEQLANIGASLDVDVYALPDPDEE